MTLICAIYFVSTFLTYSFCYRQTEKERVLKGMKYDFVKERSALELNSSTYSRCGSIKMMR